MTAESGSIAYSLRQPTLAPLPAPPELPALIEQLRAGRRKTDELFELLTPDALYLRAIAERHRIIFYVGHLEAFDWNLIAREVLGAGSLHPTFDHLFAFGIDPVDGNLPSDRASDWPDVAELHAFRGRSRQLLDRTLEVAGDDSERLRQALQMAIEHRLMHLETLSYMLPQLPFEAFIPARVDDVTPARSLLLPGYERSGGPDNARRIDIPAGPALLGRDVDGAFGWDNEFGAQRVETPAFAIDARPVTNGELLAFMLAGGYSEPSLWQPEDWAWKESIGLARPQLFRPHDDGLLLRATFSELPLPLDWPAIVSLAEARAYARWRGARLPTEAEYHRAAYARPDAPDAAAAPPWPWGGRPPEPLYHGNFGCRRYDPVPVAAFPASDSAFGVTDLIGNGWEWTDTPFQPLPGFAIDPMYPGYSQPFFDGKHFVLKGASARTDTALVRRSFRNWFQPHYPYVFAKFRLATSA